MFLSTKVTVSGKAIACKKLKLSNVSIYGLVVLISTLEPIPEGGGVVAFGSIRHASCAFAKLGSAV